MASIGGVTLNPESDMIWQDRFLASTVEQTNRRTLGGELVAYVGALVLGQRITLVATDRYGWQRKSVVDALIDLANVPGEAYTLVFGPHTLSVIFDHSSGPAVDMQPMLARATHEDGDYFTGQIKLLTV